MAGSLTTKQALLDLRREHEEQTEELRALKEKVARLAPHILEAERPEPVAEYSEAIPAQVLALADQGISEAEWIAGFGITRETWKEWRETFPSLSSAVAQARARLLSYYARIERRALERGYTSFSPQVLASLKAEASKAEDDEGLGDASEFVRVTVQG